MWKNAHPKQILAMSSQLKVCSRQVNNAEIAPRYKITPKVGWFRRRGSRLLYPNSNVSYMRQIGVDLTLQERLDAMFKAEHEKTASKRVDIGFPIKTSSENPTGSKRAFFEWKKKQKADLSLEKAARLNILDVNMSDVQAEHERTGNYALEIANAAEFYGVFEDLFDHKFFNPVVNLNIGFEGPDDMVTPVLRGNVVKPHEAKNEPFVEFSSSDDESDSSLWTLVMTNPDGHFTDDNAEYLHWMVTNIKGNDVKSGQVLAPYMQPFPAFGSGFHRFVFVLFKQKGAIDASKYAQPEGDILLSKRTFSTNTFFNEFSDKITPAGLAFCQSDWDSSLKSFFHNTLKMKEPRYEYDFPPVYTSPWVEKSPRYYRAFNLFLDTKREPKEIQEEVLKKKLDKVHPFKGQLDDLQFPNAHGPQPRRYPDKEIHGSWRLREMERERLRQGIYKDMDWTDLRRDPSNA